MNNIDNALERTGAYVQDMLRLLKGSKDKGIAADPAISHRHYPRFLGKPEVLVPADFLDDVQKIIANMLADSSHKGISHAQKEFHEKDTRGY